MQREETGRYVSTSAGGERAPAFVPTPLPPVPALALDGSLQQALEAATLRFTIAVLMGVHAQEYDVIIVGGGHAGTAAALAAARVRPARAAAAEAPPRFASELSRRLAL